MGGRTSCSYNGNAWGEQKRGISQNIQDQRPFSAQGVKKYGIFIVKGSDDRKIPAGEKVLRLFFYCLFHMYRRGDVHAKHSGKVIDPFSLRKEVQIVSPDRCLSKARQALEKKQLFQVFHIISFFFNRQLCTFG